MVAARRAGAVLNCNWINTEHNKGLFIVPRNAQRDNMWGRSKPTEGLRLLRPAVLNLTINLQARYIGTAVTHNNKGKYTTIPAHSRTT